MKPLSEWTTDELEAALDAYRAAFPDSPVKRFCLEMIGLLHFELAARGRFAGPEDVDADCWANEPFAVQRQPEEQ